MLILIFVKTYLKISLLCFFIIFSKKLKFFIKNSKIFYESGYN